MKRVLILIAVSLISVGTFGQTAVIIGAQIWMKGNLNVSTFQNGDTIPEAESDNLWNKANEEGKPAWCYYNRDSIYGGKNGKLYNWYAVNDKRKLAPKGWHIPSDKEWDTLLNNLGGDTIAGYKMKSSTGWEYSGNGDDSSGFSAFPCGSRGYYGLFGEIGKTTSFWSSDDANGVRAWSRFIVYYSHSLYRDKNVQGCGSSIRCIKD